MIRKSLTVLSFTALAAAACGNANAKPQTSALEPDDDVRTFSDASARPDANAKHRTFGVSKSNRDATFPSSGLHDGWTHEPKFPDKHADDVPPVAAVPEPSTYALLLAGIAGLAIVKWLRGGSRRPGSETVWPRPVNGRRRAGGPTHSA